MHNIRQGERSLGYTISRFLFFFACTVFSLLQFGCSALKLDKETNCLNDKAACFKADMTPPQLAQGGAVNPTQGQIVSVISTVDLRFSEELNNPQPSDFIFGGAANMTVNAVQQIDTYTYRLILTQNSLTSGIITLDFPNLRDYNGNKITGSTTVTYIGNVDIPVTLNSVSRYGLSANSGYTTIDVSWQYAYVPPTASNTVYRVALTGGSTDCTSASDLVWSATGTALPVPPAGSAVATATAYNFSVDINDITLNGAQVLLICVDNATYNKHGTGVINLLRYDGVPLPATTLTPSGGLYASSKTLTFNCSNNADKIIYNLATNFAGLPTVGDVPDPSFNTSTGAIISGTLYDPSNKPQTPYSTDPTNTRYKYICIDKAGNIESPISVSGVYQINSTFPAVTLANVYKTGTTTSVTGVSGAGGGTLGYTSVDFIWSTNQVGNYWEFRVGATACGSGGTIVTSGNTTGPANKIETTLVAYNSTAIALGSNVISICVGNNTTAGTSTVWGQDSFTLLRDDTAPSPPTVNIPIGNYGATQSLVFSCNTAGDNMDKIAYAMSTLAGSIAPTAPTAPDFNATGGVSSGTLHSTPLTTPDQSTSVYSAICLDKAGNKSTAATFTPYRIDSILPNITIVSNSRDNLSNNAGFTSTVLSWRSSRGGMPYVLRQNSTNCTDGTPLAPGLSGNVNVAGTTPSDVNTAVNSTIMIGNFTPEGNNPVLICVENIVSEFGYTSRAIGKDTTSPAVAVPNRLATVSQIDALNFTLTWDTAGASDAGSGVAGYRVYLTAVSNDYSAVYPNSPAVTATSSPANITMPGTGNYFLKIVPVDAVGNIGALASAYNQVSTQGNISIIVNSPSSGSTFTLNDGATTSPLVAAVGTSTTTWATSLIFGGTYNFAISNPPTGKVCAIHEKQFGTLAGNLTLHITCVDGYMVGQSVNAVPGAKLGCRLFQGKNSAVAGSGSLGSANGTGTGASFSYPEYIAHMGGDIYVADTNTHKIRKVTAAGVVTDVTGSSVVGVGPVANGSSADDGPCATAAMGQPMGITTDGTNLYFAEIGYGRIRKISDVNGNCQVTILAGSSASAYADGSASAAQFNQIRQIVANNDYIFAADSLNNRIRRISLSSGAVDTVVGNNNPGLIDANGNGSSASLYQPIGLTLIGNLLYAGTANNHIFSINIGTTNYGDATIVAGDGATGYVDSTGITSRFNQILALTTDGVDLYLADATSHIVRRLEISKNFRATTLAGVYGVPGDVTLTGVNARLNVPHGLAIDGRNLFVANHTGHNIRKITDNGLIGYWPLNNTTTEYSSDGSSTKNGTISGNVTGASGRYGEANGVYYFDGVDDFITTSTGATDTNFNTGNFTIAFWIKPAATQLDTTGAPRDYDIISNLVGQYDFAIRYHNEITTTATVPANTPGQIIFIRYDGTNVAYCISGMRIDDAKFHHITAQKSGNNLFLFIDGKKICTASDSNIGSITNVGPVKIGARPGQVNNDFTGAIAEMRIYNRALNEGEIHELAQDASSSPAITGPGFSTEATGLLVHYEFNGGSLAASAPLGGTLVGSASNPIGKDGDSSGSAYFNGGADLTASPLGLPRGNAPRTMCVFYSPDSLLPADDIRYIVSYGDNNADNQFGIGLARYGGVQQIDNIWNSASIDQDHIAAYQSSLNTWQHLCAVYDGSASHLYLDGKLIGSKTRALTTVPTEFRIGDIYWGGGQRFIGKIDDVRIYNNALSAMQIRQLSTQVPTGLVARYDFTGDRSDVSGWGNTLSNNGVTTGPDRFGAASSAAVFAANAYLDGTMANFPLGAASRTLCVWTNPTTLFDGLFSEVVMYGTSAANAGWGFGMDASTSAPAVNGRMYILDTAGDVVYNQPHGLNIWRHLCATYDGATERLYVDATEVLFRNLTLATASGVLAIGRGIWAASGNFNGSLDDVRVYNRVLSIPEMQALQQQANKKVYSATAYQGNLGGIAGGDTRCNTDGNKPLSGGTYKVMLADTAASRQACTSANCSTNGIRENRDWVLRPNITYILANNLPVFTTNWNGIWDFMGGSFTNPIGGGFTWTSINADWTSRTGETCGNWSTNNPGVNASDGDGSGIGSTAILSGTAIHCANNRNLYCVEQ